MNVVFRTMAPMSAVVGTYINSSLPTQINVLVLANMDFAMKKYRTYIGKAEPTLDDAEGIANMVMSRWWEVVRDTFKLHSGLPSAALQHDWEISSVMDQVDNTVTVDIILSGVLEWLYNNRIPVIEGVPENLLKWDQLTYVEMNKKMTESVDETLGAIDRSMNQL